MGPFIEKKRHLTGPEAQEAYINEQIELLARVQMPQEIRRRMHSGLWSTTYDGTRHIRCSTCGWRTQGPYDYITGQDDHMYQWRRHRVEHAIEDGYL